MSNKEREENRPTTDEDTPLIHRCQKGDLESFEALVEKHQKKMLNIAFRMIGDYEEACEVVQDAFLSVHRSIKKFKGNARFSTWLYRIVVNLSKNRLKQMKVRLSRKGPSIDDPVENEDGRFQREFAGHEPSLQEQLEKEEINAIVQRCVNSLDEEYREIIVLRDIQGLSYDEISDILDIPDGTVKSRLFRARDALKDSLQKMLRGL